MASLVLPVLFTPILTILSLSRTAHLGAANSTRAGCILPAEATKTQEILELKAEILRLTEILFLLNSTYLTGY